MTSNTKRPTQAERRARSRSALLEAAARGISRHGYASLVLDDVAAEAGYTRGALYHQFANKQELTLAVIAWVEQTWWADMTPAIETATDPLQALLEVARRHAIFCRRDIARVVTALRVEFTDAADPIGGAVDAARRAVVEACERLIRNAQDEGLAASSAPAGVLAAAVTGAVEGLVIELAGQAPFDEQLAERAVLGLIDVASS